MKAPESRRCQASAGRGQCSNWKTGPVSAFCNVHGGPSRKARARVEQARAALLDAAAEVASICGPEGDTLDVGDALVALWKANDEWQEALLALTGDRSME